jgi:hypothetical protein
MNKDENNVVIGPKILKEIFEELLDQEEELSQDPELKSKIRIKAENIINLIYLHNLDEDNQIKKRISQIIEEVE